jgi:hypothetical protein
MNYKWVGGKLEIDPRELIDFLIDGMNENDRSELFDALATNDYVVKQIAEQLLGGSTENGSEAATGIGWMGTPLDNARLEVAKRSSEGAARVISRLITYHKIYEDNYRTYHSFACTLHAMLHNLKHELKLTMTIPEFPKHKPSIGCYALEDGTYRYKNGKVFEETLEGIDCGTTESETAS